MSLCLLSQAAAASWQTSKFRVYLGEPLDEAHTPMDETAPSAQEREQSLEAQADLQRRYLDPGIGGPANPSPESRALANLIDRIEGYLGDIASTYASAGYLGPPGMSYDKATGSFRVYALDFANSAYSRLRRSGVTGRYFGTGCGISGRVGWIAINLMEAIDLSDERLYDLLAHELFHAVQDHYGQAAKSWNSCQDGWGVHIEGPAEAVSSFLTDKKFPGYISRNFQWDEFDYSSTFILANKRDSYMTASFFRHLMERYNGHEVMKRLYSTEMKGDQRDERNVLNWLDRGIESNPAIGYGLYFVFPDFAANIALWGAHKYHDMDEEDWRAAVLNVCEQVALSPKPGKSTVTTEAILLRPVSARCIEVSVTGLKSNQKVAVKFMAQESGANARKKLDSLHLGVARLGGVAETFAGEFDCERASHRTKMPACLDKPFLGEREKRDRPQEAGETDTKAMAKMWLSERQSSATGEFRNVYIVSDTQTPPTLDDYGQENGYPLRLIVSLDYKDGSNTEKGELTDLGAGINQPLNTEPAQMQGSEGGSYANVASGGFSQFAFLQNSSMTPDMAELAGDEDLFKEGISLIHISEVNPAAEGARVEGSSVFTVALEKPVRFGQTGKFKAGMAVGTSMMAMSGPEMFIYPDDMNQPTGTVTVHRFDDSLLSLDVDVGYCRYSNMDLERGYCRKTERLTASISKPFGWTYDLSQRFTSIDSPGQQLYGKLLGDSVFGNTLSLPSGTTSPSTPLSPGAGRTGNANTGSSSSCNCSCDEFAQLEALAAEMELRAASSADEIPDMSGLNMGKMMCTFQCGEQYAQCETAE